MISLSNKSKQLIPKKDKIKRTLRGVRSNIYPKIAKMDVIILEETQWSAIGGEFHLEPFFFMTTKIIIIVL